MGPNTPSPRAILPRVVATGFTTALLGDERTLREFVVGDLVAREMQARGENGVLYLFNDSLDPLNARQLRVGVNKDPELIRRFESFCGRPICEVPDPFGCHESYSEHFRCALRALCAFAAHEARRHIASLAPVGHKLERRGQLCQETITVAAILDEDQHTLMARQVGEHVFLLRRRVNLHIEPLQIETDRVPPPRIAGDRYAGDFVDMAADLSAQRKAAMIGRQQLDHSDKHQHEDGPGANHPPARDGHAVARGKKRESAAHKNGRDGNRAGQRAQAGNAGRHGHARSRH